MLLVWAGIVLLMLRLLEFQPVSDWSWALVLSPFAMAVLWFELIAPVFGLDRVDDPLQGMAETRRKRLAALFPQRGAGGGKSKR